MRKDVISSLTNKDDKKACAYANKIISESNINDSWYSYFDEFASLLNHPKSLVRNRAIIIIASIIKWDKEHKFDYVIDEYLLHITDDKPITSRECIKSLVMIGKDNPKYNVKIVKALKNADLSKYKDSMRPLIEKDIKESLNALSSIGI